MLFNSHIFIFIFLPITLIGFYNIAKTSHNLATLWLASSSIFFYGWWDSRFVGLLLASIVFNYGAGYLIDKKKSFKKPILIFSIFVNLILLIYFKYSTFFIETINNLSGTIFSMGNYILPLGISFFTFTQIAFLVDTYQGKAKEYNFVDYTLFVTYFPHLIAGPVLHHKEMMPQFRKTSTYQLDYENLMIGTSIFFMGLFKKVVLADGIATNVGPVFMAAASGAKLTFTDAWGGAISYSLQLYFDFSGYSDMAIGLSRMFGIILPLNFHSPYKSFNIIEFWRRWHMTLSRFLRDYLYIPLGGNRHGTFRSHINLMLTMLLGGLWHGAGWTYVIWGGLHGFYLMTNHAWQNFCRYMGKNPEIQSSRPIQALCILVTFLAVTMAWVIFRADNLSAASNLLMTMTGINGCLLPEIWLTKWGAIGQWLSGQGVDFTAITPLIEGKAFKWILFSMFIVWFLPNTQEIMSNYKPALYMPEKISANILWKPKTNWLIATIFCAVLSILSLSELSEFIYFQF